MPPPDLVHLFVVPLNQLALTYMVTGGAAAIAYGEPRLTRDIDVVVRLGAPDAARIAKAFESGDFYVPPPEVVAEALRRSAGHFNVIHVPTSLQADFYVMGDDPLHAWGMERRERHDIGGVDVLLAPPEYVILRKLIWFRDTGSSRHLDDVARIVKVRGDRLDTAELDRWIDHLGLEPQWQKALAQ